jgi:hypothetical protein
VINPFKADIKTNVKVQVQFFCSPDGSDRWMEFMFTPNDGGFKDIAWKNGLIRDQPEIRLWMLDKEADSYLHCPAEEPSETLLKEWDKYKDK